MGVRLIVEVLDHWQDVGLTAGEKGDLLVLAENANDKSRETWGAVHADHILKRAGKTAPSWRIAINRLMKKKALEFAKRDGKEVRGYTGQHAVYRLVELCPEPPHDGYKGHCTRPERGAQQQEEQGLSHEGAGATPSQGEGYPSANPVDSDREEGYLTANPEGYLTANAVDGLGYLTATERVSGQLTPTPLVSSFDLSSKDSPSSSVTEAVEDTPVSSSDGSEGGGGGQIDSSEDQEQDKPERDRAAVFVDSLDYRGKPPGGRRRRTLNILVRKAFAAGWTENGLRRYLDVSDDPKVRNPAAVYEHRLAEDELPPTAAEASLPPVCDQHRPEAAVDVSLRVHPITGDPCPRCHPAALLLPPACATCLRFNPAAATDVSLRLDANSFVEKPCPDCHPSSIGQATAETVPACQSCLEENPAARTNIRFRYRVIDDVHQACPDCHPKRIVILAAQGAAKSKQQQETDAWADRAMARAQQRMATGDWKGAGTDERSAGWLALSRELAAEEQKPAAASNGWSGPFKCPEDQSVYDEPF